MFDMADLLESSFRAIPAPDKDLSSLISRSTIRHCDPASCWDSLIRQSYYNPFKMVRSQYELIRARLENHNSKFDILSIVVDEKEQPYPRESCNESQDLAMHVEKYRERYIEGRFGVAKRRYESGNEGKTGDIPNSQESRRLRTF